MSGELTAMDTEHAREDALEDACCSLCSSCSTPHKLKVNTACIGACPVSWYRESNYQLTRFRKPDTKVTTVTKAKH